MWRQYDFNFQSVQQWIENQIAKKDSDPTTTTSWYKYARETTQWYQMHYNSAPAFCDLARQVGVYINRQYGYDVIRQNFPGIYRNCIEQGKVWDSGL